MLIDNADSLLKSYLQVFIVAEHLIMSACLLCRTSLLPYPFKKNPLSDAFVRQGILSYLKN